MYRFLDSIQAEKNRKIRLDFVNIINGGMTRIVNFVENYNAFMAK